MSADTTVSQEGIRTPPAAPTSPQTTQPAWTPAAKRPLRPLAERILIIGLDGATFDVLEPLMQAGRMPRLAKFVAAGAGGVLRSTMPPITPAAWTTFMTGKGPGRHGIIDFEKYDVSAGRLAFNSTFEIREKTIWEILSGKGLRVGSINVPMTYPPQPVNGFMISGFETPSADAEFTYPRELKPEILRLLPSYNYRTNWQRRALRKSDVLSTNLAYIADSFDQGVALTRHCGERYGWDLLMIVLKLVDNLQHKAWKYLDPRYRDRFPREHEMTAACFARLDDALGQFFDYAAARDALVVIMSDHGHGSLDGKAQPNLLLQRWGYLTLDHPLKQMNTRFRHWMHRLSKGKTTRFEQGSRGIEQELAVDWPRTRACVMHAGIYGFLYLNLRGRQPYGVVDPADYDRLRDDLVKRFLDAEVRAPDGRRMKIFAEVHKTEELYRCSRADNPDLPDLLLVPQSGLAVVRKIRGFSPVRWTALDRLEGTHRVEGILAIGGRGVASGAQVQASIVDIAPTVLALLGLRVPADMEGRVLSEAFSAPLTVEHEPPLVKVREAHEGVYSAEEERILQQRLSDLGYLE